MEYLLKNKHEIKIISHKTAKDFIEKYHYSKSCSNTSAQRFGLFRKGDLSLLGVAVYMVAPCGVAKKYSPKDRAAVLTLSRLCIIPGMPTNSASFLMGRSIRLLRRIKKYKVLVTYADIRLGHTGAIYRATNWKYDGLTDRYYCWLDSEGKQISKYSTKTKTVSFMDSNYQRVGPYRKHRFFMEIG